ncbi:MAG: YigZ family protein [Planctomycetes bacterium]|nr:YigZ family protein [Planctomycetota bacterium]
MAKNKRDGDRHESANSANSQNIAGGEEYYEPAGSAEAVLVEKKSRFIGFIVKTVTEAEALGLIAAARKRHYDAAHNVFAYIIKNGPTRYSDDGEPQGTAGQPVLHVLSSRNLVYVCCIVSRYFGGVLLGAGGLVRAYSSAAALALDQAGIAVARLWDMGEFTCPYQLYDKITALAARHNAVIENADFGESVRISASIAHETWPAFRQALEETSSGIIKAEQTGQAFRTMPID